MLRKIKSETKTSSSNEVGADNHCHGGGGYPLMSRRAGGHLLPGGQGWRRSLWWRRVGVFRLVNNCYFWTYHLVIIHKMVNKCLISQLSSSPSIFYYHQFFILISVNGQIPFDMTKLLSKHKGFLYKMMIAALTHFCLAEFSRFSFTCKRSKCYQVQK